MDIKSLIHYYAPYKKTFYLILLLVIIEVILQFIILLSVKPMLSSTAKSMDGKELLITGAVSLSLIAIYSVVTIIVMTLSSRTSAKVASNLREGLFDKVMSTSSNDDIGADKSGMMVRLMLDVDAIQKYTVNFFSVGVYFTLTLIASLIVSAFLSAFFFLSFIIAAAISAIVIYLFEKNEYACRRTLQTMLDGCVSMFRQFVDGSRSRRFYGQTSRDQEKFRAECAEYSNQSNRARNRITSLASLSIPMIFISIITVSALSVVFPSFASVEVSVLVICVQLIILFDKGLYVIPFCLESAPVVITSMERVESVLSSKSEGSGSESVHSGSDVLVGSDTGLYPTVMSGMETSVIGRNGSGKSNYIHALVRFSEVGHGDIVFDGQDITGLDPTSLRKRIAYAGQLALTFDGTVRDNICLWRDIPEDRLTAVCSAIGLSMQLDARIKRTAKNIPQGEVDRISIARALVTDADLYIFDDCFIGLDHLTKMELVNEIRHLLKGRTILFVSDNTDIAVGSDRVSIMDSGRLFREGTLEEIRNESGFIDLTYTGVTE